MKKQIIKATFLLMITMFITSCGSNTSENKTEKKETTENVKYQCPMKCEGEKTYDKPGSCPVCNMDIVKVNGAHEHHEHHEHDSTNSKH